ncbi:MAG TPA: prephenate dehydrogenase/arogenate dehydrogenase family protein [Rhodanobacter sp.]|nr:prephenate dehydrogenase/arogenate dehydrogenase family protein [Rhodanobacter sp.]
MNFAILGHGRFGRAFAGLLLEAGHRVCVFDPQADIPPLLAAHSLQAAVESAQWIVLAMPVPQMRDALLRLRPLLHAGQTVLDVGSVKMLPCAAMEECLGAEIAHVGTHPLFGPISLARGDRPLRTVICASEKHPQAAAQARQLFADLGCEVIDQDPATHDRAMASTHALAFFIAKGLVDMGVGEDLTLAPPSFQGLQNMLAAVRGDAGHLFAAIQQENPFATEARSRLLASLAHIHDQLLNARGSDALDIPGLPADA